LALGFIWVDTLVYRLGIDNVWQSAANGKFDEVIYHVEAGFDVNSTERPFQRRTLIDVAVEKKHEEIVAYLVSISSTFYDHK